MTAKTRCTGHCCRRITISIFPEDLKRAHQAWMKGEKCYWTTMRNKKGMPFDIHIIYPMLKFMGYSTVHSASGKLPKWVKPDGRTKAWAIYSCKHFNKQKKICSIYNERPRMCRSYPDGGKCKFRGCTNDEYRKVSKRK